MLNVYDAKQVVKVFDAVIANGTSDIFRIPKGKRTLHAVLIGIGAVAATINWYGTNSESATNGILLATSTLSGTTSDFTGAGLNDDEWPYMYAVLSGISGTGATITATIGV